MWILPILVVVAPLLSLCLVGLICSFKPNHIGSNKKEFKVSEMLDDFIEHQYIEHNYEFCDYVSYEKYGVDESEFIKTIKKILYEYDGQSWKSDDDDYFRFLYKGYKISVFVHYYDIHIINYTLKENEEKNKEEYCNTVLKDRLS